MSRHWIVMALLGLGLVACGRRRETDSGPSQASTGDMANMPGMPGMTDMERPPAGDSAGVRLDRTAAERFGISFARAAMRPLNPAARVVGTLAYAEPRRAYVSARVTGWVERLYADYTGRPVRQGDPLLALYSPELVSAQEEYLSARRLGDSSLTAAALRRLVLWDIPEDQIAMLEQSGAAQRTLLLRAPIGGEIAEKMVTLGEVVRAGDNLFLIADRTVLWADLAVFEADARMLRVGTPVELAVDALPGRSYAGRVTFIQPQVDQKTRTLTARIEVPNRAGRLRPGMFVTARLASAAVPRLSVPLGAVLPTGTRDIVFVNRGDGAFLPREVTVGTRNDSLVEIVQGLKPGDEVVASATYLLDSESNLASAMQGLMLQMGMGLDMGGMQMEEKDSGDMKGMKMDGESPR